MLQVKSGKQDRDDMYIIENTYKPVISRDMFEVVQNLMK
ncbi:recombinase family protein [Bacillus halotolerans]|nr:recombinase family protein [Bacillus halotolerans]